MNKKLMILCLLMMVVLGVASAQTQTPAFPGAEGYGMYTTGGRGGSVLHVTSLDDSNDPGTLRWALAQNGARTIVFDVSGTIHLTSEMTINKGDVTIAGQSAPGDGICVADYPFVIKASNVIIRYLRFRLGNRFVSQHEGDGLGGMDNRNIIIDHCSVSWSVDECLSVYGNHNQTVQWCIISQSMNNSGHSKGAHGYGGNWGGAGATYHHNLLCHHNSRVPRLGPRPGTQLEEHMDLRNNVFYNWSGLGCYGGEAMDVNIVNNYYKPGPATLRKDDGIQKRIAAVGCRTTSYCDRQVNPTTGEVTGNSWLPTWHKWGQLYVTGNVNPQWADVTADNWTLGVKNQIDKSGNDRTFNDSVENYIHLTAPLDFMAVTTHSAEDAYARVLDYAGASLHRDAVDTLMVYDTRHGVASHTGNGCDPGIINSQNDNRPDGATADWSAWPVLQSATAPLDTDRDGMPDAWETSQGLNPNDDSDRNTLNADGYTMLEVYLAELVAPITAAQTAGGTLEEQITPDSGDGYTYTPVYTGEIYYELVHQADSSIVLDAVVSDSLQDYLTAGAVTLSDKLTADDAAKRVNDLYEWRIHPVEEVRSADPNHTVIFPFSSTQYYLQPLSVSFTASRHGTDGTNYDVTYFGDEGEQTIVAGERANRNNEAGGWYSHVDLPCQVDGNIGQSELRIYIYNTGTNKAMGFADVRIRVALCERTGAPKDAIEDVLADDNQPMDLYTVTGQLIRRGVRPADLQTVLSTLPSGAYVWGNKTISK